MSSGVSMREDLWDYKWVSPAVPSHHWRDASYVLLAESHSDELGKGYNSQLIDQLITPNSLLLVEGVRSQWQTITPVTSLGVLLTQKISQVAMGKISAIIGWDYFNQRGDRAFFCQFDPAKRQYSIAIGDDARDRPPLQDLSRAVTSDSSNKSGLEPFQGLLLVGGIISTFPKRTEAMIQTLQAVEQRKSLDPSIGKVFLMAGKAHLVEGCLGPIPQLSLASLYAELNRLPAAVISVRK
jgi:hypothetical protein